MKHCGVLFMYCFFVNYRLFYFFKSHQTINKGQVLVIMMLVIRMVR